MRFENTAARFARRLSLGGLMLSLLFWGAVSAPAPSPPQPQTKTTMKISYRTSPMGIREEDIPLAPLRRGLPAVPGAPAAFGTGTSYACPYVNEQQNSRSAPVPEGKWGLAWKAAVLPGMVPRFVLQAGAYSVIQAASRQIFDSAGRPLGDGRAGPGQVFVDAATGLILSIDRNGFLAANRLADGRIGFISSNWGGDRSAFSLVQKRGRELLLASFELPKSDFERPPGTARQPASSVLEQISFGESVTIQPGGLVTGTSSKVTADGFRRRAACHAARGHRAGRYTGGDRNASVRAARTLSRSARAS